MLNKSVLSLLELECVGNDLPGIVIHGQAGLRAFDLRSCRRPLPGDLDIQQMTFPMLSAKQKALAYRCARGRDTDLDEARAYTHTHARAFASGVTSIGTTGADDHGRCGGLASSRASTPIIGSPRCFPQDPDLFVSSSTTTSFPSSCNQHLQLPLPPSTWLTLAAGGPILHGAGWGQPQMTSSVLVSPYGNHQQHDYNAGQSHGTGHYSTTTSSDYCGGYGYSHDTEYMAPYSSGYQYDCDHTQAQYMQPDGTTTTTTITTTNSNNNNNNNNSTNRTATPTSTISTQQDTGEYITGLVQRKIILSKLHDHTQHQDVKKLLEKVQGVLKIQFQQADGKRGKKCHALVTLVSHEAAQAAISRLDGKTLKGRNITVRLAVELQRPHRPQHQHQQEQQYEQLYQTSPSSSLGAYAASSLSSYSPEVSYGNSYTHESKSIYTTGDGGGDSHSGRSYRRRASHKGGSRKDHPMVVDGTIG